MSESVKPTTIRFPGHLKKRLRQCAVDTDSTMETIIEEAYLAWESAREGKIPERVIVEDAGIEAGLSSKEKALLRKFVQMLRTEHWHPILKDARDASLKGLEVWTSALGLIQERESQPPRS